jgi:hypothetical protein
MNYPDKEVKPKRYMLLGGDNYYPLGGIYDFISFYDEVQDAQERGRVEDWYQVIDTTDMKLVAFSNVQLDFLE